MGGALSDDAICVIPYKGKEYLLSSRDLTLSRLRVLKNQFGYEYGAYKPFFRLFFDGDADAIAGAIWIVLSKNEPPAKVPPFDAIDFSPYDMFKAINDANDMRAAQEKTEDPDSTDPLGSGDGSSSDEAPTSDGSGTVTGSEQSSTGS